MDEGETADSGVDRCLHSTPGTVTMTKEGQDDSVPPVLIPQPRYQQETGCTIDLILPLRADTPWRQQSMCLTPQQVTEGTIESPETFLAQEGDVGAEGYI